MSDPRDETRHEKTFEKFKKGMLLFCQEMRSFNAESPTIKIPGLVNINH